MKTAAATLLLLALAAHGATNSTDAGKTILLIDFANPGKHTFTEMNDPVMGGESTGTTEMTSSALVFDGEVVDVPSLKAPGFIKTSSPGRGLFKSESYPDISSCAGLTMHAKQSGDYAGFRLSFSNAHPKGAKFFAYGFKAHFDVGSSDFEDVQIPFNEFTSLWDDGTGNPIKTCAENKDYCPDAKTLKDGIAPITIWGEGVAGKVHLEVQSISAYGC